MTSISHYNSIPHKNLKKKKKREREEKMLEVTVMTFPREDPWTCAVLR